MSLCVICGLHVLGDDSATALKMCLLPSERTVLQFIEGKDKIQANLSFFFVGYKVSIISIHGFIFLPVLCI